LEGDCFRDWFDRGKIHADDERLLGHDLRCDLQPGAGRGAQIDKTFGILEEGVLLVELDQLEGGTGTVALFFGEVVVFVETTFAVLRGRLLACEDCYRLRLTANVPSSESPSWLLRTVGNGQRRWDGVGSLNSARSEKVAAG
jgi:hypothetical protein